jgi:hypothetical protein
LHCIALYCTCMLFWLASPEFVGGTQL